MGCIESNGGSPPDNEPKMQEYENTIGFQASKSPVIELVLKKYSQTSVLKKAQLLGAL
jgi:hypothetical protein